MIERFDRVKFAAHPGRPTILWRDRAILPCGCMCVVGFRMDNSETASAAIPCSADHHQLMHHFNLLMKESMAVPPDERGDRQLVDVADELLEEAARHVA